MEMKFSIPMRIPRLDSFRKSYYIIISLLSNLDTTFKVTYLNLRYCHEVLVPEEKKSK